jgi:hypothetical protein
MVHRVNQGKSHWKNPAGCQVLLRNSARKRLKRRAKTCHALFIRGSQWLKITPGRNWCGSCHWRSGLNPQNADFNGLV